MENTSRIPRKHWPRSHPSARLGTVYSWDAFAIDILLYMGLCYSVILWWTKHFWFWTILMLVSGAWLSIIALLFSWSSNYGTWTNGLPLPWMGLWYDGWFYNWSGLAIDTAIIAALEYLALFLYRGLAISASTGRLPRVMSRGTTAEQDA